MIEICPASPGHVGTLAARLRTVDVLECAAFGLTAKRALRLGLLNASIAWTAKIDGRPEAMFGVSPISLLEGKGRPWMLMTDDAARQHRALLRLGELYTAACHRHYPILQNMVHARNDKAIRWLARLGYAIGGVDVIGGQPMRPFIRSIG